MPELPLGIMRSETNALDQLKKEIYVADKPYETLASRIGELSETERANLVRVAKIVLAFQRENVRGKGYSDIDYMGLIERLRQGLQPHLKVLLSDVLNELEPVKVIKKPKPDDREALLNMYDQEERFKTPLPEYDLPIQKPFAETPLDPKAKPSPTLPPKPAQQLSFLARLEDSESSGRSDAEITLDDGRKYVGLMQMGEARLEDYKRATNTSFTQEQFKNDTELQDKVGDWHLADIDKNIDAMGDDAKGYSRDGLRAIAHLGGVGGMKKYVKSKGQYNPSDQLGTSLKDYYNKFSGAV